MGRLPDLHHALHASRFARPKEWANSRAWSKELYCLWYEAIVPVPSQSPHDTQPLPLYTLFGLLGMSGGRLLALLHSLALVKHKECTYSRASSKERYCPLYRADLPIEVPNQSPPRHPAFALVHPIWLASYVRGTIPLFAPRLPCFKVCKT